MIKSKQVYSLKEHSVLQIGPFALLIGLEIGHITLIRKKCKATSTGLVDIYLKGFFVSAFTALGRLAKDIRALHVP